jgi:Zn-dependent M28 family amino/carboxypeptidase
VLKNETVIYTAHWDHLGRKGRKIFHGALDNAGGIGALLQIARAYKALPVAPKRTVLFIATTGEEQGLLGSQYYASHPLYPLETTVADLNIDVINAYGRTSDLRIIGSGRSDLDALVMRHAAAQGRTALPDANPELGSFYRSDQFEFAKAGVPVVFLKAGTQVIGKPAQYGADRKRDYVAHLYHTVDDVVDKQWDLSGAVEDAQLLFQIGLDLAQGTARPQWSAGSEFQRREAVQ